MNRIVSIFKYDDSKFVPYKGGANDNRTSDILDSQDLLRLSIERSTFYTIRLTYALIFIGIVQLIIGAIQIGGL
jgi:hypothetical protein